VKVERNAGITLLESGGVGSRSNSVIEVSVCENAKFDHVRIQGRSHEKVAVTHLFANLLENSSMKSFTLTVNGKCTRNEYFVDINGGNAKAHIGGAAVGDRGFTQDDTVFVSHNSPNCESRQVFKKVLRNGAKGVFQGKILVKEGAQKTDGYQISQGLMLDDDSSFLAKPELEIYADDVICSHGSTCGEIDENALFYLTSRGIPIAEAQDMLVLAFLNEAIDEITNQDIKEIIAKRLKDWMLKRHKS
jgi:Fe-S cluster assembly protein SufD